LCQQAATEETSNVKTLPASVAASSELFALFAVFREVRKPSPLDYKGALKTPVLQLVTIWWWQSTRAATCRPLRDWMQ
jgi:hypothetical protein